ncbi:MAG: helix-turn-helix domain-containing protein [Firmicutes bacterium]|nr:helix-turn-helix domain-containing protein [Bacillota bacterium]
MEDVGDIKNLKDLGDILRTRRIARGLSLEEAQGATKIRQHHLMAMEAGDFDALPGEVYVRGFLRTYAGYIGLDSEKIVEQYRTVRGRVLPSDRAAGETVGSSEGALKLVPGKGQVRVAGLRRMTNVAPLVVATIVIIGGIVIHIVASRPSGEGERPRTQAPPQATAAVVTAPKPGGPAPSGPGEPAPSPQGRVEAPPGVSGQDASSQKTPGQEVPSQEMSGQEAGSQELGRKMEQASPQGPGPRAQGGQGDQPAPQPSAAGEAPAENGRVKDEAKREPGHELKHELKVDITQRCWVRVVADGRVVFEKVMNPGDSRTWTAKERLRIKAGNAAGIILTYNDKKLEFLGKPGQVKEWSFPPAQS